MVDGVERTDHQLSLGVIPATLVQMLGHGVLTDTMCTVIRTVEQVFD